MSTLIQVAPGVEYDAATRTYRLPSDGLPYAADGVTERGEALRTESIRALVAAATGGSSTETVLIEGRRTIVLTLGAGLPDVHLFARHDMVFGAVA